MADSNGPSAASPQPEWVEVPVFIHGVTPEANPGSSQPEYFELLSRVKQNLQKYPGKSLSTHEIFVTWGVPTTPPQSDGTDQYLAEVERRIQAMVHERMGRAYSDPFGLTGYVRDLLFFGVSDLFYYISADGECDLRQHVFTYLARQIHELDQAGNKRFSLTIFGHSAGSVIAHDLLYHLFTDQAHESELGANCHDEMQALRSLVHSGRLRVRHLYTFGSPISALILRATSLVEKFRHGERLKPKDIGFRLDENLGAPRWVNFWTKHDLASYPLEFLYANEDGLIKDQPIAAPLSPVSAHGSYWTSDEMAAYIAETF